MMTDDDPALAADVFSTYVDCWNLLHVSSPPAGTYHRVASTRVSFFTPKLKKEEEINVSVAMTKLMATRN
jgi:hypothetical protein